MSTLPDVMDFVALSTVPLPTPVGGGGAGDDGGVVGGWPPGALSEAPVCEKRERE